MWRVDDTTATYGHAPNLWNSAKEKLRTELWRTASVRRTMTYGEAVGFIRNLIVLDPHDHVFHEMLVQISVEEDANGRVNIVLNETKQRTVSGNMHDAMIRNLLMAAAKGSSDPGLRAETVTILVNGAGSSDVRDALVFALENDQNTVVRWRASGLAGLLN